MPPVLDAAVRNVLTLSSPDKKSAETLFLTAPVRWVDGPDGDLIALGVGSVDGKPRREVVATLHSHAAQNAFPGMSRQNTRNMLDRTATQEGTVKPVPTTVLPPPAPVQPDPATVPPPSPVQPAANTVQPPRVTVQHAPTTSHPPPADLQPAVQPPPIRVQHAPNTFQPPPADLQPGSVPNGIENTRPGPILLPKQQLPAPIQRSGTEYFTPAIDVSELKRL